MRERENVPYPVELDAEVFLNVGVQRKSVMVREGFKAHSVKLNLLMLGVGSPVGIQD